MIQPGQISVHSKSVSARSPYIRIEGVVELCSRQLRLVVAVRQWDKRKGSTLTIKTDSAKLHGWGVLLVKTEQEMQSPLWTEREKQYHINYLELLTVLFVLKSLLAEERDKHLRVIPDNTTVVRCVNKLGSKSEELDDPIHLIWQWCETRRLWVSAAHIPRVWENVEADTLSHKMHVDTEWKLNSDLQEALMFLGFQPEIDLFASRINTVPQMHSLQAWSWHLCSRCIFTELGCIELVLLSSFLPPTEGAKKDQRRQSKGGNGGVCLEKSTLLADAAEASYSKTGSSLCVVTACSVFSTSTEGLHSDRMFWWKG